MICEYCGKELKTLGSLHQHLKKEHNYNSIVDTTRYDIKYLGLIHPKCPYCNQNVKLLNTRRIFATTCDNNECKQKKYKDSIRKYYSEHPEAIEKHRNDRIAYLQDKTKFEKTAWGKRANHEFSFLEQWFVDKIIVPYNMGNKFDIINDYSVYPYFLDFAFVNANIDFELDGRCHFSNGEHRIEHDITRDSILKNKGWKIYRITYDDVEHNEEQTINDILSYISNNQTTTPKSLNIQDYYTYQDIANAKKQKNLENKNKKETAKQNKRDTIVNYLICLETKSQIDFSKYGWSVKAIQYLNSIGFSTKKHGVVPLIREYYPQFFEHNSVHIRKGTKMN